ncbi:MAG: 3-deoxy-manno-octulosonate cytidylyltransferase [Candidatus Marinimicrobia bacterium]|nr:3-deoxy-manno-octulosonate cytidylyltransferase [Candidatus Neomarinimicrobiota bacterium]|tara:strand:+ start:21667 stop:22443 length:777 start_codon:yes stop_codon:yes gene_type:complete
MIDSKIAAIIPARMASSRYPGKPLININGLPMIEHVRRRVMLCQDFCKVVVATCDIEIKDVVEEFGGEVIMTSNQHLAASDRVAEAAKSIDCTHIINVQGDEILVLPDNLKRVINSIKNHPNEEYWNATSSINRNKDITDESIVKCIVSKSDRIIFCSRDFSFAQKVHSFKIIRMILGIIAYNRQSLLNYNKLPRTPMEQLFSIDQFRIIENDIPLISVPFPKGYIGINNPHEEIKVKNILAQDNYQNTILKSILNFK